MEMTLSNVAFQQRSTDNQRIYKLADVERANGIENRNLFVIRAAYVSKGQKIGEIVDRAVYVTADEATVLYNRIGKRGRSNWTGGALDS